jgi:hypothetical protein
MDQDGLACSGSSVVAGMDFVGRRNFKLDTDTETIEHELYASGEYQGFWESEV